MKKIVAMLVCVLIVISAVGPLATAEEKIDLRLFFWYGAEDLPYWQQAFDRYMEANPNVNVVVETATWNEYWTKLQTQIASQSQADVMGMVSMQSDFYIQNGALLNLNEQMEAVDFQLADYWPAMMEAYTYEGGTYCLPYDLSTELLLCNLDIFEECGIEFDPNGYSQEEFLEICEKLTTEDRYAISFALTDWTLYDLLTRAGLDLLDEEGKLNLNQPEAVELIQWYADLTVKYGYGSPYTGGEDLGYFNSGKVAIVPVNPEWVMRYRERMPDANLDVMLYPTDVEGGKAVSEGGAYAVSAYTQYPAEAFGLLAELTSAQTLGDIVGASHRGIPGCISAKDVMLESPNAVPNSKLFMDLLDNGTRVNFVNRTEVEVELKRQMELIYTGEATAAEAIAAFQEEADFIMSE